MLDIFFILSLLFLTISYIFDGSIILLGLFQFINIEIFQNINNELMPYTKYLIILSIFFIVINLLLFFKNFMVLGYSGGNPAFRSNTLSNLVKYSIKTFISVTSFSILLAILDKGNVLLYIVLSILGIILLFFIGKWIHYLMQIIINNKHNL